VYDTGARWSEDGSQANRVIVPYLRTQGLSYLDRLVLSHSDNDHSGGAEQLAQALPLGRVITSAPAAFPTLAPEPCLRGQHWNWDGVDFQFLHPPPNWPGSDNERSCVLRVSVGATTLLLTGDIERHAEHLLRTTENLRSTILVAPHHGSRSSSSPDWVTAIQPAYVLYASGYRNRYRFPHPDIVARYAASGAQALDSPGSGAIRFTLNATGTSQPERYRCLNRRYWHLLPGDRCDSG
jgi:competence protein ComEC